MNKTSTATTAATAATISKKQDILLIPIMDFFRAERHIDLLLGILLTDKYKLSLRIIDWFVTNYSKKHNIVINKRNSNKPFIVFLEYKSQLKAYSKKQFDPFCRRTRINFECGNGNHFETTIGQLNFFRWAIEHGIIEYIIHHYAAIEEDMTSTFKSGSGSNSLESNGDDDTSTTTTSSSGGGGKTLMATAGGKKKSTITATKSICKHNVKIIVSFD